MDDLKSKRDNYKVPVNVCKLPNPLVKIERVSQFPLKHSHAHKFLELGCTEMKVTSLKVAYHKALVMNHKIEYKRLIRQENLENCKVSKLH